jgi:phosphatidylglycerophosphatase A
MTLANSITSFRFLAAPFLWWAIATDATLTAVALLFLAAISDFLDGFVARRSKTESVHGAFLDPLADKAIIVSALGACAWRGIVGWWLPGVVLLRDGCVTALRLYTKRKGAMMPTSLLAKSKTAVQFAALFVFVLAPFSGVSQWAAYVVAFFTIASGVAYAQRPCALFVASLGGVGFIPFAPGTVATVVIALLHYMLRGICSDCFFFYVAITMLLAGWYVTHVMLKESNEVDPSWIVIDEAAAFWLLASVLPASVLAYGIGFLGFRFFDITKTCGVHVFEQLPGAWGVMADDLMAAVLSGLLTFSFLYSLFL